MSRLKKKQNISGGYKPLVAASLAVALGVSVASATWQNGGGNAVDANAAIDGTPITNPTETDTSSNKFAGILVKPADPATPTAITISADATINAIDKNSVASASVYGIYIDSSATSASNFSASSFQKITIGTLTQGAGGNAAVLNNAGSSVLSFDKVGIVYGTAITGGTANIGMFGIQNTLAGTYNFGSGEASTSFAAFAPSAAAQDADGKDSVGLITSADVELNGNLLFSGVVGQAGGEYSTSKSGKGGNAYGIASGFNGTDNKTITLNNAKITFATITGAKGGQAQATSGTGGTGGDAYGVYLDGSTNQALTISGNGSIVFSALAAGVGGDANGGTAGTSGTAYVINNAGSGTLAINNGAKIIAGSAEGALTTPYGIYNNLAGVSYAFGTTALTAAPGANNAPITEAYTGLVLAQDAASLKGTLSVTGAASGKVDTNDGIKGGNAIGISMNATAARTLTLDNAGFVLSVTGGDGSAGTAAANVAGEGGSATGLMLTGDKGVSVTGGVLTLKLTKGGNGGTGIATSVNTLTAIDNQMTGNAGILDLSGTKLYVGASASGDHYGITNAIDGVNYKFGATGTKVSGGNTGTALNGFVLTENAGIQGKLIVVGKEGASSNDVGAAANGIVAGDNKTLTLLGDTTLTVTGGNGVGTGVGGVASGIYLSSTNAMTIDGNYKLSVAASGGEKGDDQSVSNAYIINNAGTGTLTFSGTSLVAGTPANDLAAGTFGIYNQLTDVKYVFGNGDGSSTAGTVFTIQSATGAAGDASNNGQSGADAQGIVMAGNLSHTGYLKQTITGAAGGAGTADGKNGGAGADGYGLVFEGDSTYTIEGAATNKLELVVNGGNGGTKGNNGADGAKGDAFGIVSKTANAQLTIKADASATISAKAGTGSSGGEAVGILVKGTTSADRTVTQSKLTLSGALALKVGDNANTTTAYGLKLEDGVFSGDLEFAASKSTITVKNGADTNNKNTLYGIHTSGESTIESGTLTFATDGLVGTNVDKYVLFNDAQGTLTLGSGVKVKTGTTESGIINNNIDGAIYAFGGNTLLDGGTVKSDGNGADLIAFEVAQNAALGGTLKLVGQNAKGQNSGNGNTGGDATGLNFKAGTKYTVSIDKTSGLTLDLAGGVGTEGTIAGKGGNAIGINLASTATSGAKIDGGVLTLKLAGGLDKTGGASTAETIAIQIDNASTLELANDGIIVGEKATGTTLTPRSYAIYSNLDGAKYSFGTLGVTTTGATGTNVVGGDITGMILANSAEVAGKLTVNGGNANGYDTTTNNGFDGGRAVGISLALPDNTAIANISDLELSVKAGAGTDANTGGVQKGQGGDAIGIELNSAKSNVLKINGGKTATIAVAESDATTGLKGKAIGIRIATDAISQDKSTLTLETTKEGVQSADGILYLQVGNNTTSKIAYGLELDSGIFSGTLTFNATNSYVKTKDGVAHGIHTNGNSKLENAKISFETNSLVGKAGNTYALYNAGSLEIDANSQISAGTGTGTSNFYAANDKTLDVAFAAGSTTTFNGASAFAVAGTGAINLTLENNAEKGGAKLIFNGDAGTVYTLEGNNADILLAGASRDAILARINDTDFNTKTRSLTITNMNLNNSSFVLAAKAGTEASDTITIKDSTASATAEKPINNNLYVVVDEYATSSDKVVTLATVEKTAAGKYVIFNNQKEDGEFDSAIYKGFTTAEVKIRRATDSVSGNTVYTSTLEAANIQVNTDFVAPTTAALSAGVSLFSANLNSLSKRMGELRNDPYSQGAWARVFGGEQTTNFGAKQSTVYSTVQAGYDYKLALGDAANYIGAAISYTKGMGGQVDPVYKQAPIPNGPIAYGLTSSNTDGVEVALYNSYVANSGLYSDTIAKFGYYMSDITMANGENNIYSTSNLAIAVSEEIGYKVSLGESNEWFITPQGEVAFAYIGGSEFTQNLGSDSMKSTQDAVSLLRARVGAAWGYDFSYLAKESDVKASIYLGTYYAYDYFMGGDTTLSTTVGSKTVDYTHNAYEGTGRFVMNLGTNIDVQDRTKVYFDFEKSFGGNIQTDYQVSLGVRFGFGEKVSAPKQEEKKATEAALKPKELDESAE